MPQFQNFTAEDKIVETQKVTKGYFYGDVGTITSFQTASLSSSQKEYYLNVQQSAGTVDEFSVSYGHYDGSGSSDDVGYGQTKSVYWSMANLLLFPEDLESNGFQFSGSTTEKNVWFLTAERGRMLDRVNRKNWTLTLSGTLSNGSSQSIIKLTDDSDSVTATPTPVGPRYNIVSGALGTVVSASSDKCYGWFYPNLGIMALDGTQLSASIPGGHTTSGSMTVADAAVGFAPNTTATASDTSTYNNHYKLYNAIRLGSSVTLRNEEDKLSTQYFVRAKAAHWNFSVNPTFSSGSTDATFRIDEMTGNPVTFITTVGLYDGGNRLVAVGKLSGAKRKSFTEESIMKITLDH